MERSLRGLAFSLCCTVATGGVASAQPCVGAILTIEGAIAPCAGILVPTAQANVAVQCLKVELPKCRAESAAQAELCDVDRTALRGLLDVERSRVEALAPVEVVAQSGGWVRQVVAFAVGAIVAGAGAYAWAELAR